MRAYTRIVPVLVLALLATWAFHGCTAGQSIHGAARRGDLAAVRRMVVQSPMLVDADDGTGDTPLHVAAAYGQLAVAKYLLANEARVSSRNKRGETPLQVAERTGHPAVASLLRCHLLCQAAARGDAAAVLSWLHRGVSANCRAASGERPLHYAVRSRTPGVVALLARQGADVNTVSSSYYGYDASVGGPWPGITPLILAARCDDVPVVSQLLQLGAEVNKPDGAGVTPLHYSAMCAERSDVVACLLAHGADANARDSRGLVPLHYLASNKLASLSVLRDTVRRLLLKGAVLNAADDQGNTLLHQAVHANSSVAAAVLADTGAPINVRNKDGETPLSLASRLGDTSLVQVLSNSR